MVQLKHGGVLKGQPSKVQEIREHLDRTLLKTYEHPEILQQRDFQTSLCEDLVDYIFEVLSLGEQSRLTRPFRKHVRLLQSIEDWLADTGYEHHSVRELSLALDVNERTLRRVISGWYGV